MKYDHIVKHDGIWYEAWEEIPTNEPSTEYITQDIKMELPFSDSEIEMENEIHIYTYEELEPMTAKEIRRLAEDKGFKLSKVSKEDIITEFLSKQ